LPDPAPVEGVRAGAIAGAAEFLERAGPLLGADEARHNLILALAWTLHERPEVYPEFALWVAEEAGFPVGAALLTPPHRLVLADASGPEAVGALAAAVAGSGLAVPGVVGNRPTVDRFNDAWAALTGAKALLHMAQGVFALERVRPAGPVPGAAREAVPDDRDLVLGWMEAFNAEALPHEPEDRARLERGVGRMLDPGLPAAGFWLWEDGGEAVGLCGYGGPFPGGARVGPVYTPPARRGRGYATGLVAAVSAWLLGHGRRRCFLYTDLANPASNAVYRRIGYEQVAESAEYGYEPAS